MAKESGLPFSNRVALVTGASRGIGLEIATAFAVQGATVILVARGQAALDQAAAGITQTGRVAVPRVADIGDAQQMGALMRNVVDEYGHLDILVNNASISPIYKRAQHVTEAEYDEIMAINAKGTFFACQAAGNIMLQQGHGKIINVSSALGSVGAERLAVYAASKAMLNSLTKTLALEWGPQNVQVNAVAPGWVATGMTSGLQQNEKLYQQIMRRTPGGKMLGPGDVAPLVLFLASSQADRMNGTILPIDDGMLAG